MIEEDSIKKIFIPFVRSFYWYISKKDKNAKITFLNYGYADDHQKIKLDQEDEKNRYPIQLYHHVASQILLKDLKVLEVGCGRGGGAAYIAKYLKPKSIHGIDFCQEAIKFCQRYYSLENLSFSYGNALKIPFADNTFDVVINIESSQSYGNMELFLKEVKRVLKPSGYFLFADLRYKNSVDSLKMRIKESGLKIIKEEWITSSVIRALNLDSARKENLIKILVPKILQRIFKEYVAIKNSKTYKKFIDGKLKYFLFCFTKTKQ